MCVSAQARTPTTWHPVTPLPPGPQLRTVLTKALAVQQREAPPLSAVLRGLPVLHRVLRTHAMASQQLFQDVADNPFWAVKGRPVAVRWVPVAALLGTSECICTADNIAGLPRVSAPPESKLVMSDADAVLHLCRDGRYEAMINDAENHTLSQTNDDRAPAGEADNAAVNNAPLVIENETQQLMVKDVDGNVLRLSTLLLRQLAQREMRAYLIDRLRAVSPDLVVDDSPDTPSRPQ